MTLVYPSKTNAYPQVTGNFLTCPRQWWETASSQWQRLRSHGHHGRPHWYLMHYYISLMWKWCMARCLQKKVDILRYRQEYNIRLLNADILPYIIFISRVMYLSSAPLSILNLYVFLISYWYHDVSYFLCPAQSMDIHTFRKLPQENIFTRLNALV